MMSDRNKLAIKYLDAIIMQKSMAGFYSDANDRRTELHNKLAKAFGFTADEITPFTDNLDKYIKGFIIGDKDPEGVFYVDELVHWLKSSQFRRMVSGKLPWRHELEKYK